MVARGTPAGTPAISTSAGLTPQMALVNADRTPTVFFFRWLLNSRAAAQTGQTPWLSDIDAAGFALNNLGGIELDAGGITFADGTTQTTAAVAGGVTGVTASAPLASSGGATPNITMTSPLPVANGGSGSAAPSLIAGANVTITGAWPNQTIAAAAGTSAVSSVFGRAGAVVAVAGDYTVAQVTGAVASSRQIIAGAGLTGGGDFSADRTLAVNSAAIAGGIQTPWLQNIAGAGFSLTGVANIVTTGTVGVGITPAARLEVAPIAGTTGIKTGALEFQSHALNNSYLNENCFYNGGAYVYRAAGFATMIELLNGVFTLYCCPSGAAGAALSRAAALTILNSGAFGVGVSPAYPFHVGVHANFDGYVRIPNLYSGNPGAGTKSLWYDPADGNRVKFAA